MLSDHAPQVRLHKMSVFARTGLFFFGFFCFSPLISFIFINIIKAPFVVSEIPMAVFFLCFRKELGLRITFSSFVVLCSLLLVFTVGVGALYREFPLYSILSNARTYVVILFWMSCFSENRKISLEHMVYLALGSSLGWLCVSLVSFNSVALQGDDGSGATSGAMLAMSMLLSISYLYKRRLLFWGVCALSMGTAFFSGTRRAMLSAAWAFFSSLLIEFNIRRLCVGVFFAIIVSAVPVLFWKPLGEWVKSESPYMYVRIFVKTESLLTSGTEAENDAGRFNAIRNLLTVQSFAENLFPRGMVSKRTMADAGTGIYMDCPAYEAFHSFGFIGTFLIFGALLLRIFKHAQLFLIKKQRSSAIFAILGSHMFIMMFYEGGFISFAPFSIFTAFAIVKLFSNKEVPYFPSR